MPPRQARRSRRRVVPPAASLPRPSAADPRPDLDGEADFEDSIIETVPTPAPALPRSNPTRRPLGVRAHHVVEDLSYVRTDLIGIAIVATVATAFVVGMAFVI